MLVQDGSTETIRFAIRTALQILAGATVIPHVDKKVEIIYDGNRKIISDDEFILAYEAVKYVEKTYCEPYGYIKPYTAMTIITLRDKVESYLGDLFYQKKLRVAFLIGGKDGCTYWRCEQPSKFLNKTYPDEIFSTCTNIAHYDTLLPYDIIVVQRALFGPETPDICGILDRLQQSGKKIVYETDDSLGDLLPDNACYYVISPSENKAINWLLQSSDAIFTTTQALSERLGHPEKTYILPNSMDLDNFNYPERDNPRRDEIIFILWAGGDSHEPDINYIEKPLSSLIMKKAELEKKTGKEIIFGFMGYFPKFLEKFTQHSFISNPVTSETKNVKVNKNGKEMLLNRVVGRAGINYIKGVGASDYHEFLSYLDPDIFLSPLLPTNKFNEGKSNIKPLEGFMAGAACVVSDVGPYSTIPDEVVIKARTPEQFVQGMQTLIVNEKLRKELSSKGNQWARENFDLSKNVSLWKEALFKIGGI